MGPPARFVNAHAHADKSWWGRDWVSYGGEGGTDGRIAHERKMRDDLGIPGVEVTVNVLREFLRHGTTRVRSHVDVDLGIGLRGLEVVREANAALGDAIDLEWSPSRRTVCCVVPVWIGCSTKPLPPESPTSAVWIRV
ncbi:hypothetical protein M3A96_08605 [Helcobacillus massiliensis]|uniref:Cytosine/adenosine deaminase-related metal-dependent hydrolase n=1 Tax=Helcobacillus massiliensis TaxID=521392 RepID=A0A839QSV1_9MICO|nr:MULTISPECIES: hypothetical protein [Helcobacillus]MBB3022825.1 cytosine/adenosine deaminase-related metal-dependent hydrolase [Helcobacillus massiliensis]MCG7428108.1 hypothetical protein [Helcobacillus sp. ACRRO]MCT1558173.1 hypothetical protein [Helcobacillus massiliensis]MCT2036472.1 hypothetical protein [Helcobacillus massiliensis]MCT2332276.1 hypothetical protein [Helcobacillus massiliensis]